MRNILGKKKPQTNKKLINKNNPSFLQNALKHTELFRSSEFLSGQAGLLHIKNSYKNSFPLTGYFKLPPELFC